MVEMDEGDAEEMEPAPTNRAHMPPGPTSRSAKVCAKQSTPSTSRGPPSINSPCWPKASRPSASTGSAAADTGEGAPRRMQDAFLTSSRYEYTFWEMAYQRETWPL